MKEGFWVRVIIVGLTFWSLGAKTREVEVQWTELKALILDKSVTLVLRQGAIVEGKVTGVQADALRLDVKKTANKQLYPKGPLDVPRSDLSTIQVRRMRGYYRALGAAAGAAGGAVAGWAIAEGVFHTSGEGQGLWKEPEGVGLTLGLAAAAGLAGYFIGRDADTEVVYLKIVP